MSYTIDDFVRDYIKENIVKMSQEQCEEALESLSLEKRLAGLSVEEIQQYLEQLTSETTAMPRKPRRKK